jgi:hypothetical protein
MLMRKRIATAWIAGLLSCSVGAMANEPAAEPAAGNPGVQASPITAKCKPQKRTSEAWPTVKSSRVLQEYQDYLMSYYTAKSNSRSDSRESLTSNPGAPSSSLQEVLQLECVITSADQVEASSPVAAQKASRAVKPAPR